MIGLSSAINIFIDRTLLSITNIKHSNTVNGVLNLTQFVGRFRAANRHTRTTPMTA